MKLGKKSLSDVHSGFDLGLRFWKIHLIILREPP